jgi:hypothetical protein
MIHSTTNDLFLQYADVGMKIIELGDQLMDIGEATQFMRSDKLYKEFNIQSIDIHGKNRALPIDLSKESKERFEADLLTDFGTVEHVSGLYNALLNCHNWTKPGGIMIHANPKTGTFPGHGVSFFTMEFWEKLAKAMDYQILELFEKGPYSDDNPDKEVIVVLVRSDREFITKEDFDVLVKDTVFTS